MVTKCLYFTTQAFACTVLNLSSSFVKLQLSVQAKQLVFRQPAGTSRGIYTTRQVWYVTLTSPDAPGRIGVGECAPLPDLSCDATPNYETLLHEVCRSIEVEGTYDSDNLRPYPSIRFGLETAFRQFEMNKGDVLWASPFTAGQEGILINGLIWMGSAEAMHRQIVDKMAMGFRCLKLKIGAIDFEEELRLLGFIRSRYSADELELRVDANGAFTPQEAMKKLESLAHWDIHSIEQPIRAGQWKEMEALCRQSPIPIALDEELIGIHSLADKKALITTIRPQYIILKPTLHGGISGSKEWISMAETNGIGWWVTSALESNIGLNALAQWCATLGNTMPQGLGTGQLFTNNVPMPLRIQKDRLWFIP